MMTHPSAQSSLAKLMQMASLLIYCLLLKALDCSERPVQGLSAIVSTSPTSGSTFESSVWDPILEVFDQWLLSIGNALNGTAQIPEEMITGITPNTLKKI